ncbi:MAG: phosphatase domain-containing protein [Bacteroidota bacterium]
MEKKSRYSDATVKVYHGYGHTNNLFVYGHVLKGKNFLQGTYTNNAFINFIHLIRLFFISPIPGARVKLHWQNQSFDSTTESDGFFKFEWQSDTEITAGWHEIQVDLLNAGGQSIATGRGKIFIPHSTQYGFISDIDDTVLISHSGTTGKKLWSMLTKNPRSRKTFADVVNYYQLLSTAHTEVDVPNPFFYVSSSEWNLYDYLNEFFKYNQLPKGAFLLNEIKKWYQLFKTGTTKHQGKFNRVERILKAFPAQQFVLLGDNSQSDPDIYKLIADEYPHQILSIYIRNISPHKEPLTKQILASINNKSIYTLLYKHTSEAIIHSRSIGLIV